MCCSGALCSFVLFQVNEALLQKRASSLGFEGSVEQVLFFFVISRSPLSVFSGTSNRFCFLSSQFDCVAGSAALGQQTFIDDAPGDSCVLVIISPFFSFTFQPKSPAGFPAKSQFKINKAGAATHTPSHSPSYNDVRQRSSSSASGGAVSARAHVRLLLALLLRCTYVYICLIARAGLR